MARRSALFSAAGRLMAKPAMRPLTRFGSALHAYPQAVARIGEREFPVVASLAPASSRTDLWRRLVDMYPYFTEYQERTSREIPVVILSPETKRGLPASERQRPRRVVVVAQRRAKPLMTLSPPPE